MGNCSPKGVTKERCSKSVRVLTVSGGLLEFKYPVMVKNIIAMYPGYGVFRQGQASMPLPGQDVLLAGRLYYLLPLEEEEEDDIKKLEQMDVGEINGNQDGSEHESKKEEHQGVDEENEDGSNAEVQKKVVESEVDRNKKEHKNITENDEEQIGSEDDRISTSGRSSGFVESLGDGRSVEVLPQSGDGVWRVKLVIDTKQLEEILAEEVNTEALIEKMRMAAAANASTPRRVKGTWGIKLRPALYSLFRGHSDDKKIDTE